MTFWLIVLGTVAVTALFLLRPLLRGNASKADENPDLQVYRDQMTEVKSDLARGVLSEGEAERTRTEISRRILEADKLDHAGPKAKRLPKNTNRVVAAVIFVGLLAGSVEIYRQIGANGMPDLPVSLMRAKMAQAEANRPTQAEVEARVGVNKLIAKRATPAYRELVAQLRKTAAKRPNDLKGQKLLAENEARLGNFAAARIAQARVIAILGKKATSNDYTDLAELMIIATNGYVSPKAERALGDAIKLNRANPRARYYSGLDLAQNGRADLAFKIWSNLLAEGPPTAPWIKPIRAQIADVARMAGIRTTTLPRPAPNQATVSGPTPSQIETAKNMTPAQRQKLIKSMVLRLSTRLGNEGGSAAEWARLITAYSVLGDSKKALETFQTANVAHSGDAVALAKINAAAVKAGIVK